MAIVDPEQHAAAMAGLQASFQERKDSPGADGVLSRAFPVAQAFHEWMKSEIERETPTAEFHEAACRLIGNFLGTVIQGGAEEGKVVALMAASLQMIGSTAFVGIADESTISAHVHRGMRQ